MDVQLDLPDGKIENSRVDTSIRSSTGLFLQDISEVANIIHRKNE